MTINKTHTPRPQRQFYGAQDKADAIADAYTKIAELNFSITPIDVQTVVTVIIYFRSYLDREVFPRCRLTHSYA